VIIGAGMVEVTEEMEEGILQDLQTMIEEGQEVDQERIMTIKEKVERNNTIMIKEKSTNIVVATVEGIGKTQGKEKKMKNQT